MYAENRCSSAREDKGRDRGPGGNAPAEPQGLHAPGALCRPAGTGDRR